MWFPQAGIEANPLVIFVVGFLTAAVLGQVGLTGGFLTLPYMVSLLGFDSPYVTPTNMVGNINALGGIYGYIKEKRMAWPLAITGGLGAVLGAFVSPVIRLRLLSDPRPFRLVIGLMMLFLAGRLLYETTNRFLKNRGEVKARQARFAEHVAQIKAERQKRLASGLPAGAVLKTTHISLGRVSCNFWDEDFEFQPLTVFTAGFIIAIIGSVIGVGGAFLMVPFLVSVVGLPIYIIAGATITFTFTNAMMGIVAYYTVAPLMGTSPVPPDWLMGLILAAGGLVGSYIAARTQRYFPEKALKVILGIAIGSWGWLYILNFFVKLPFRV